MQKLTRKIYRALEETGESALIGKGWGNLGKIEVRQPWHDAAIAWW